MMQFRIGHLLLLIFAVAILSGLVFAAPPVIGMTSLTLFLLVCPAIWFSGAVFARGSLQAFFIGGIGAGIAPYVICAYASAIACVSLFGGGMIMPVYAGQGSPVDQFWAPAAKSGWWLMNLVTLIPGPFSFLGGGISVLVYLWVSPRRTALASHSQNGPPSPHFSIDGLQNRLGKVQTEIELHRGMG